MVTKYKKTKKQTVKGYLTGLYRKGYKTPSAMRKVASVRYEKVSSWFASEHPTKVKRVAGGYYADVDKMWETGLYDTKKEAKQATHILPKWAKKRVAKKKGGWKRRGGMIDSRKDISTEQLQSGLWYRLTITGDYENESSGEKLEGVVTSSRWHKTKLPEIQQKEAEKAARAMFGESGWHLVDVVSREWETRNIG